MICKVRTTLIDDQGGVLIEELGIAKTFRERAVGLLGRRHLPPDQGLYFERCSSVHMFGMRFPVDVVFLDADGVIVKTVSVLRPWRIALCGGAEHAVELAAGMVGALRLRKGQCLLTGRE